MKDTTVSNRPSHVVCIGTALARLVESLERERVKIDCRVVLSIRRLVGIVTCFVEQVDTGSHTVPYTWIGAYVIRFNMLILIS